MNRIGEGIQFPHIVLLLGVLVLIWVIGHSLGTLLLRHQDKIERALHHRWTGPIAIVILIAALISLAKYFSSFVK
jgi:hypothetical protein